MFQCITAFIMSVLVFLFNLTALPVPDAKSLEDIEGLSDIFEEYLIGETVIVLDSGTFSSVSEKNVAIALQGLVARESPQIYITYCSMDDTYIKAIEDTGAKISHTDENGENWTLSKLIVKFRSYIKDGGYILYRAQEGEEGLNIATNYATLEGWLPVPEELEDMAKASGLTKMKDISDDEYTLSYQKKFFSENKKRFNDAAVIHQNTDVTGLRDFAIQQNFYVFFTDDNDEKELKFRNKVLLYFGDNTHILGWTNDEVAFVDSVSESGNMISPADHAHNNSILASVRCEIPVHKATKNTYTDSEKHYVALVMSDGDNMQWIQNGYSEYFEKLALMEDTPVTWSFSPILYDFSPVTVKTVFENAGDNDYFMAGVSGIGYMHPTQYPKKALAGFTDITASAMNKNGLEYVQILEATPENELEEAKLLNSLSYYARYDNIKGGIISLDPDRYAGGNGKAYLVDGKPFLTYRLSLWHPSGDMSQVTKEWLKEQADIVNSYPADIHSIDGYSVINIHPWTISIESLSYFVSCLDDTVKLVTVEELVETMYHNSALANPKTDSPTIFG